MTINELLNNYNVPAILQKQYQQKLLSEAEFVKLAQNALLELEALRDDHIRTEQYV